MRERENLEGFCHHLLEESVTGLDLKLEGRYPRLHFLSRKIQSFWQIGIGMQNQLGERGEAW
jgi:hypothetical protein